MKALEGKGEIAEFSVQLVRRPICAENIISAEFNSGEYFGNNLNLHIFS
jgi:hypothetical protein